MAALLSKVYDRLGVFVSCQIFCHRYKKSGAFSKTLLALSKRFSVKSKLSATIFIHTDFYNVKVGLVVPILKQGPI